MKEPRINEEISAREVFLLDENSNKLGVVKFDQAMWLAFERGFDVVEVGGNANPPVVKMLDYRKELYRRAKELRKQRSKQRAPEIKEIKLSLKIGEHDLEVKASRAKEFFAQGDKVKINLALMGREMAFKEKVPEVINSFKDRINGEFEAPIKKEGKRFWAIIKKNKG